MNLTNLNQKIILQTGIFGVFMGISTTLGWCQEKEIYILIVMIIATILYLNKQLNSQILLHSIIIGLSWGFDCSLIQVIFFETYTTNNPIVFSEIISISRNYPKIVLILLGSFFGLMSGLIMFSFIKLAEVIKN